MWHYVNIENLRRTMLLAEFELPTCTKDFRFISIVLKSIQQEPSMNHKIIFSAFVTWLGGA